ncbi:MAG: alpha/beta hydrolase [Planctomycetes bacterium]|nr:alpha/beta hydrolase [Planctomycetota bacterium]
MSPRDLPTPAPERLFLEGPTGKLAATLEVPAGEVCGAVLLLHPHPEHGGTRRTNVVRYGALGALAAHCAALRIDFRGAGESEGRYDHGRGEIDDVAAAFDWLAERFPGTPCFVWGFSFGSRVGLDFVSQPEVDSAGYLAVAWPSNFYSWPRIDRWPERAQFLAGDQDEFVDFTKLHPLEEHGYPLVVIPGADHFFRGCLGDVRTFTAQALNAWLKK